MIQGTLPLPLQASSSRSRCCAECGGPYEPYARAAGYQRFCSQDCRSKGYRREQAGIASKRAGKAEAILERLKRGPATSMDLMQVGGIRYSARVFELRQRGKRITTENHDDYAVYRLEE